VNYEILAKPKRLGYYDYVVETRPNQNRNKPIRNRRTPLPTILTLNGFQVRIRTNDHIPAHVHVHRDSGEAKIQLGINGKQPQLIKVSPQMSNPEAKKALRLVEENNEELLQRWKEIHK
jgi:hypothetical protein